MKHLLFAIGLVATLASCSKREEPTPEPTPTLIGRWRLLETKTLNTFTNGQPSFYSYTYLSDSVFVEFTANKRFLFGDSKGYQFDDPYELTADGFNLPFTDVHGKYFSNPYTIKVLTNKQLITTSLGVDSIRHSGSTFSTSTYVRR